MFPFKTLKVIAIYKIHIQLFTYLVYDRPENKVVAMRDAKSNQTDPTIKALTAE